MMLRPNYLKGGALPRATSERLRGRHRAQIEVVRGRMYGNHQSITRVISGFRDKGPKRPERVLELTLLCVLKGGNFSGHL